MAAAAARIAMAAELASLKAIKTRELALVVSGVDSLTSQSFTQWERQLKRQARLYEWPEWFLDLQLDSPDGAWSDTIELDDRNAFAVITKTTDDHAVADLIDPDGSAREAFAVVSNHHHKATVAGRSQATLDFFGSTMASTGTSIITWIAYVKRTAIIRHRVGGGTVTEADKVSVLLAGLLKEFDPIKTFLHMNNTLTWADAIVRLMDFAQTNKITELTKAGAANGKNNIFAVGDHQCHGWTANRCKFGDHCRYAHDGPGSNAPESEWYPIGANGKRQNPKNKDGRGKKGKDKKQSQPSTAFQAQVKAAIMKLNPSHVFSVVQAKAPQPTAVEAAVASLMPVPPAGTAPAAAPGGAAASVMAEGRAARVASCNLCLGPHDRRACPLLDHSATDEHIPSYTFSASTTPPASPGIPTLGAAFAVFMSLLLAFMLAPCAYVASHRPTTIPLPTFSSRGWVASAVALMIVLLLSAGAQADVARVTASCYYDQALSPQAQRLEWCADSGSNRFVTNDMKDFVRDSVVYNHTQVAVAGGNTTAPCQGTVLLTSSHGKVIQCNNVLFMPDCAKKLMPASVFTKKGCKLMFEDDMVTLMTKDGDTIFSGVEEGGLYYYECYAVQGAVRSPGPASGYFGLSSGGPNREGAKDFARKLLEAHWAYGHLHFDKLRKLLGLKKGDNPECAACTISKSRQCPLHQPHYERSTRINHRMHADLGFTQNSTWTFQLFVDDNTRMGYIDILEDGKSGVLSSWIVLKAQLENQHQPWKFAFFRSDSEPIYSTKEWADHCKSEGLEHEFSSRYRQDQNGVVERAMQTVGTAYRTMMIHGCAPPKHIPQALKHANVIRNNSPTKANKGWTPLEVEAGRRLPINPRLLQAPLFCLAYAHVYEQERPKHAARGIACVYCGYDDHNDAYYVMEWESGRFYYTADVTFHPNTFPYREDPQRTSGWLRSYEGMAPHLTERMIGQGDDQGVPTTEGQGVRRVSVRQEAYQRPDGVDLRHVPDVDVAPETVALMLLNMTELQHAQLFLNITMAVSMTACNMVMATAYFVHQWGTDPETWSEAMAGEFKVEWLMARLKEMNSFKEHGVLEIVPRADAAGHRIFKPKIVLKIKVNPPTPMEPLGTLDKFKYRLTIAALTKLMVKGIDYEEKYASTVRWNSIKILIAIAVQFDYDIVLFDIATFFLYGEQDRDVYMEQAEGWDTPEFPATDYVCLLKKAMYGLPNAPLAAQKELNTALTKDGVMHATTADDCVYVNDEHSDFYAALGAHVDDLMAVGDQGGLDEVEATLAKKFKITKSVNPSVVTGVQIIRDRPRGWLKLHQGAYVTGLLESYGMMDCHPVDTPMDPGTAKALMMLPTEETPNAATLKAYQTFVGEIIWLMKTRPDMLFAINLLSRFLQCATPAHLEMGMNRVLKYLRGSIDKGIVFTRASGAWGLSGKSDSDLAGDLNSSRSTLGVLTKLGDFGAIMASSKLERKICTSTGQAETYGMASLIKEVEWERHILRDLRHVQVGPTTVMTDNSGVFQQSTKAVNHTDVKHYRISQAFIRSKGVKGDGTVEVVTCPSLDNESDNFTKAQPAKLFAQHVAKIMGPQTPEEYAGQGKQ